MLAVWPNLYLWIAGWAPKQHRPLPSALPRGTGLSFSTVCIETKWCQNKAPTGPVGQCALRPASAQCGPSLTLWAPTDMDWALVPTLRALSPGPPACLFSESQRPLAPCPCAAAGSGTASTSPPCCTWRKEVVLVGPLVCSLSGSAPHHTRQTGTSLSSELSFLFLFETVSKAQTGFVLEILLSQPWC